MPAPLTSTSETTPSRAVVGSDDCSGESVSHVRAPAGGIAVDGQRYEGGQYLPGAGEYQAQRAARARREVEGHGKITTRAGIVLVGDKIVVRGFVEDRPAIVCGIRESQVRVRFSDGTSEWAPGWSISDANTQSQAPADATPNTIE